MLFLYYYILSEVDMEFFRENKKIIVGFIAVAVILWLVGFSLIPILLGGFGG